MTQSILGIVFLLDVSFTADTDCVIRYGLGLDTHLTLIKAAGLIPRGDTRDSLDEDEQNDFEEEDDDPLPGEREVALEQPESELSPAQF